MITTLNPKVSITLVAFSLIGLDYELSLNSASFFSFFLGAVVSLPLIALIWNTMKKNWPLYKKFYSQSFHKRDIKTIKKSWRLTWWIFPYTLIAFTLCDLFILLNPEFGTPFAFLWGVFFSVFGYTFLVSQPYYEDLIKKKTK